MKCATLGPKVKHKEIRAKLMNEQKNKKKFTAIFT